mmetsp:Transcript_23010/g.66712  ORF Transcript_23010/g.66712 Transcript_23010/m.66712 type:complete len:274 (+) Transcript_23010:325-1146(+)
MPPTCLRGLPTNSLLPNFAGCPLPRSPPASTRSSDTAGSRGSGPTPRPPSTLERHPRWRPANTTTATKPKTPHRTARTSAPARPPRPTTRAPGARRRSAGRAPGAGGSCHRSLWSLRRQRCHGQGPSWRPATTWRPRRGGLVASTVQHCERTGTSLHTCSTLSARTPCKTRCGTSRGHHEAPSRCERRCTRCHACNGPARRTCRAWSCPASGRGGAAGESWPERRCSGKSAAPRLSRSSQWQSSCGRDLREVAARRMSLETVLSPGYLSQQVA